MASVLNIAGDAAQKSGPASISVASGAITATTGTFDVQPAGKTLAKNLKTDKNGDRTVTLKNLPRGERVFTGLVKATGTTSKASKVTSLVK